MSGNMIRSTLTVLGCLLALAPSATGHMIMASPKPYGNPNNSPLDPSGSDYPCKGLSPNGAPANEFKVGQAQQLSFSGSAVHGGGSCQLAVTTDKNPTKESKFKVIHSIEGGCPGVGGPSTFEFTPPAELPNGEAVFAWTWFNHIGNREMYMNCAAITVSGGASDTKEFEALPDMALANINVGTGATCKTAESSDYVFDNPGKSVQKVGSGPFQKLCGGAATGGGSTGGGGAAGGAAPGAAPAAPAPGGGAGNNGMYTPQPAAGGTAPTEAPASSAASAPAPSAPSAPPASSAAPPASTAVPASPAAPTALTSTVSTMVTVTASSGAQSAAPTSAAPAPTSVPASAPAAAQPSGAPAAGAPAAGGSSCATNGAIVCNGETQFGICNNGNVIWQAVAVGTKCQDGKIAKRDFVHRHQRRAIVNYAVQMP